MALDGVGRLDRLSAVGEGVDSARLNGVGISYPGVQEWYTGGTFGIEQGFTITRRPAGETGPLALALRLARGLRVVLAGSTARLVTGGRRVSYRYGGLVAVDAKGRRLAATLALAGRLLRLRVADRRAVYPVRIDPFIEREKIVPGDENGANAGFTDSVASSLGASTALVDGADDDSMGAVSMHTSSGGASGTEQPKARSLARPGIKTPAHCLARISAGGITYSLQSDMPAAGELICGYQDTTNRGTLHQVGVFYIPTPKEIALRLPCLNAKPGALTCSGAYGQVGGVPVVVAAAWVRGIDFEVLGNAPTTSVAELRAILRVIMANVLGGAPPVTTPPPATTGPPTVTGTASAGQALTCSGGSVTVHATRVLYRWVRQGTPIPGAASRLYRVREIDEGTTLTCDVTAYKGSVASATVASRGVYVSVPFVSGCPAASMSLKALLRLLGVTRAQVGDVFARSSSSGQEDEDFFCLTPVGVLVGYPPAGLLDSLPVGERARFGGRVVWISTSNAFYSILGVGPGTTLGTAGGLLKLIGPFDVGSNVWYLAQDGSYLVVLIVRGGVVVQVGIADWSLAGGRSGELAFLDGLETIYQQSVHVSGPLEALDGYWAAIGARNFAGAFGYEVPGLIGPEAGFVSSEQREHVLSAQFQGRVTSQSGTNATIQIVSLITHDEQYGCRTWSGSYHMSHRPDGWRIARANIQPRSCNR
jgi:hypothetical protein